MDQSTRYDCPLTNGNLLDHAAELVSDDAQQTKLSDALREHEQSREEQQRVPFDLLNRVLKIFSRAHQQDGDRAKQRSVRGFKVHHRVEEEEHKHKSQDYTAPRKQGVVADGVLVPEHLHVDINLPIIHLLSVVTP